MIRLKNLTGEELTETWETTGMSDIEIEMTFSKPGEDGIIWVYRAPNQIIPGKAGGECLVQDNQHSETDSRVR